MRGFHINNLSTISFETDYTGGSNNSVEQFYKPCLSQAVKYARAVGYFRSTVLLLIGQDLLNFTIRGGKVRLICSPNLERLDRDILFSKENYVNVTTISKLILSDFMELLEEDQTAYRAKVFATLLANGSIELKLALRSNNSGIYHEKLGVFTDAAGNQVSFIGSANETHYAWSESGNYERIEVFCSYNGGREAERSTKHSNYFDSLWLDKTDGLNVVRISDEIRDKICTTSFETSEEIDPDLLINVSDTKSATKKRELYKHQQRAIDNWYKNNYRGIFKHATGSGKTFTAIKIIEKHLEKGPALVLVPSTLLLKQWGKEIYAEIPDVALLKVGSGNSKWKRSGILEAFTRDRGSLKKRVVLATMQTSREEKFRRRLAGDRNLLVVVDEVHNLGSTENSNILKISAGSRLGLSATPERYGDQEGTDKILSYFEGIVEPVYTIENALKDGRLTNYDYFPFEIHLSDEEQYKWDIHTKKIRKMYAQLRRSENGDRIYTSSLKIEILNRSRIAKKAVAKINAALHVIVEHFKAGEKWLVYCEDIDHMEQVDNILTGNGFKTLFYHSDLADEVKEETLKWFNAEGGILLSVRCLDEGVDIPSCTHALILASSQNPRQFIQRRGRVLRKSPGKYRSVIFDTLVIPSDSSSMANNLSLLRAELVRAYEFSKNSNSRTGSARIREIIGNLGINIEDFIGIGTEELDENEN